MNQTVSAAILSICLMTAASAQNVFPDRTLDSVVRDFIFSVGNQSAQADAEVAKRRDALYRERQFIDKVNRFVDSWTTFAAEYNQKHAFNVKAAEEISKAFHDLEVSEGWPRVSRK
jgi:hypothetical protein